jgi:uncharacterized membrane protein YhaH (DUF805 family)
MYRSVNNVSGHDADCRDYEQIVDHECVSGIWLLIECGLLQGSDGPNRFGPDPLAG